MDSLRQQVQDAKHQCLQEEHAAQHAVKIHAEMSDRYHGMVGALHGQLNKMYEEKSRAQNTLSIQEYDIAAMKRQYEEEIRERDKIVCRHESHAYISETDESRAVAKMEFYENEMTAMKSAMSVNQRLQMRDRANDAEVARARVEVQLLEKELEMSQHYLQESRDAYNTLECDVAEGWKERYGRNKVQIRLSMEEFELREQELRDEIRDMQDESADQARSVVLVRRKIDSPDGITEAKVASMAKHEHHVYDEMIEKMGHLSLAKTELKAATDRSKSAREVLFKERSSNYRELREVRRECEHELAEEARDAAKSELAYEKAKNELAEMEKKKTKYKDLHAQVEHDYYECECQEVDALQEAIARLEATESSEHHQASSSSQAAPAVIAASGTTTTAASSGEASSSKAVSKRGHEKIEVPAWPTLTDLNAWKASLVQQVVIACGDNDIVAWKAWLQEAMIPQPDLEALDKTPEIRFASIDAKLGYTLQKVVSNAGDEGGEVHLKLRQEQKLKGSEMEFLKGRVVLAIILNSFRTSSQVEVQCDVSHLNALQFNGDSQLHEFYNKWTEIHSMIREEDLPSDKFLRDMLYNKLEDKSTSLAMDLREFDRMNDADKTCEFLLEAIRNRIRKNQEKRLVQTRMHELNRLVSQKALPFEGDEEEKKRKKPKAKAEPKAKAKATPSKEAEKPDPKAKKRATPVYPSPSPKRHAGKPSKPGSSKDRSPSRRDPKKTPCVYHFTKPGGCRNADKCLFSHDQKVYDANKGKRYGSRSPSGGDKDKRARSPTPNGKTRTKTCYKWMEGKCNRADCPFAHEKTSGSASPGRGNTSDGGNFFISDVEDDAIPATGCKAKSTKKLRWNMHPKVHRFHCPDYTGDRPANQTNKGKGPYQRKSSPKLLRDMHGPGFRLDTFSLAI